PPPPPPRRLLQEQNPMPVALAARTLGAVHDPRGMARSRELARHADPRIREDALLALGEFSDYASVATVNSRLKGDNLAVRVVAIDTLGRIGASGSPRSFTRRLSGRAREREGPRAAQARGASEEVLRQQLRPGLTGKREAGVALSG